MFRIATAFGLILAFTASAGAAPPPQAQRPLDLDSFLYSSPSVRKRLEQFLDGAKKCAGDGWTHRILATTTDRRNFIAQWCKTTRRSQCIIYRPANVQSVHGINIHATPDRTSRKPLLKGFSLEANQQASPKAWAVMMSYRRLHGERTFRLELTRNEKGGRPSPDLRFPITYFNHVVEFEGVAHEISVNLPNPHAKRDWDVEIPKILATPKTLREALLADLDQLERHVENPLLALRRFRAGGGAAAEILETRRRQKAREMRFLANKRLEHLEFGEDEPKPTIVTDDHRRQVLKLVRAWLESRRELVRNNSEAIYRDVTATFPIVDCLAERK